MNDISKTSSSLDSKRGFFFTLFALLTLACSISFSTSCSKQQKISFQGYVEGEYVYKATPVSGRLFTLNVYRGDHVQANQLLFTLDPEPETSQLTQAQQQLKQAIASFNLADVTLQRDIKLFAAQSIDKQTLDNAKSNYLQTAHRIQELNAFISAAQWRLSQKRVYSQEPALVFDTYYRVGEFVPEQRPVLALLPPQNILLIFYAPELLRSKLRIGEKISFTCDGCKQPYTAYISFISAQAEYTPPVIFSLESRNKLVYRAEARFGKEIPPVYPGQPIDVYLAAP